MALGVLVLSVTLAIMTGFEGVLRSAIIGAESHIVVRGAVGLLDDWNETEAEISTIAGVESVSPFITRQALLRTGSRATGVLVRGFAPGSAAESELEGRVIERLPGGRLFEPVAEEVLRPDGASRSTVKLPAIVIGGRLADLMGVPLGEKLAMLSPEVGSSPFGLVPRFKRFSIKGTFEYGLYDYETAFVYVSLAEAQKFFKLGDRVSGLEVRVDDIDRAPEIAKLIAERLLSLRGVYRVEPWTVRNKSLWEAIKLEKRVYFLVLLLLIVLASFSIVTTLILIVLEKRKDIAVLKALGASTRSIGNVFRIQGAVVGGIGTLLGLISGLLFSIWLKEYGFPLPEGVFPVSTVPVKIEPLNFLVIGVSAFAICCLATIYPARRASRVNPCDVFRYE